LLFEMNACLSSPVWPLPRQRPGSHNARLRRPRRRRGIPAGTSASWTPCTTRASSGRRHAHSGNRTRPASAGPVLATRCPPLPKRVKRIHPEASRAGSRSAAASLLHIGHYGVSIWGRNIFANDLGGAERTWNGGAGTSSRNQANQPLGHRGESSWVGGLQRADAAVVQLPIRCCTALYQHPAVRNR
jgi:hypothetical protein